MADRFGTRRVFMTAVGLFTTGSLLCGLSRSVPMLVGSRILQGMGGAMMTPVGRLALVRTFPRSEMITAMNYVVIPALLGPLLGPVVGGLIVHWLPWRTIFFVNLPIGIAGLWLTRTHMPDYRDPAVGPVDRVGFLLFGSGVALLSYVLEVFGEHGLSRRPLALMALTSAILLGCYWVWARRIPFPVIQPALFRLRTFRIAVLGGFVTRLGIGGMPFLLPLLYQVGLGYRPWQAGLLTTPQAVAAITMKILSKPILARLGYRRVLIANTVLLGGAITVFSLVGAQTPVWCILLFSFLQGFFASLQFTSLNSLVYADVEDRDASKASSIASTAQQMSLSFGIASGSLIVGWFLTGIPQTQTPEFAGALHKAFLVLGSVTALSSLTFWGLRRTDGSNLSGEQELPD
jgi:EmrB/QacA subfamily drug resistance transporter